MSAKLIRLNRIKEILNEKNIGSHESLVKILNDEGIPVTQATLSRDFVELGVIRVTAENGPRYIVDVEESGNQVAKLIKFEIVYIDNNESLIVIRTLAGRAQGVAQYLDRLNNHKILGTIAGDDTVLIVPVSVKQINELTKEFEKLISE
jgi:transcriptional regulator of arginine metabolism